jgi:hypothetical protein
MWKNNIAADIEEADLRANEDPMSLQAQLNAAFLAQSKARGGRELWAGLQKAGYLVIEVRRSGGALSGEALRRHKGRLGAAEHLLQGRLALCVGFRRSSAYR